MPKNAVAKNDLAERSLAGGIRRQDGALARGWLLTASAAYFPATDGRGIGGTLLPEVNSMLARLPR